MYELTASEAATVLSVLSRAGGGESSDRGPLGIPTSTFYAARRKVYEAGWVLDRYVPHPWANHVAAVDFVLVHPSPTDRSRLEREWTSAPSSVVVWSGLNSLFGVFFRTEGVGSPAVEGSTVSVTGDSGSVPVYFDYSRPWSRFIRQEAPTGYPRALGESGPRTERTPTSVVAELTGRDQEDAAAQPGGHRWHSPTGLPRSQHRLLERGLVRSRSVLNVGALPPFEGRTLGEIVFLTGRLRSGYESNDLLGTLNNDCHVSPVLLVDGGRRLFLMALGQLEARAEGRTRLPRAAASVTAALDSVLTDLKMSIERTDGVRKLIDHQYDRVFSAPGASPPGR